MSDLTGISTIHLHAAPGARSAARLAWCLVIGLGLGACESMSGAWKGTTNTVSGWFESDDAPADGAPASTESPAEGANGSTASAPSPGPLSTSGMATGAIPGMSGGSGGFRSTAPAPSLASVPSDAPKPPSSAEERQEATEGLVADRERAQYTDQGGRRDPMVVRPLGAATAPSSTTAPPAQQAARAVDATPAQPVAPRTTALAERLGAAPPPPPPPAGGAPVPAATPAAPAPITAQAALPQALRPTSPAPAVAAAQPGALIAAPRPMAEVYGDETIVIDGSGARGSGAAQQLAVAPRASTPRAAFDPGGSSVSSQIGTISFAPGSTRLSPTAKAVLADVAQLRADVDGAVRIEARGADANSRAAAISAELKRLGVPAGRLYAGSGDGFGEEADIYLDY